MKISSSRLQLLVVTEKSSADGALFVADEGEFLELDELVDRAAHGRGIVRRAVPGPDGTPAEPNPA